ncbi:ATP synthase A1, C subunit [Methanosalsum zhilinae DSM 4017]|uniref:A-type ATP synthase subunit C n=1 Tax=Methanosalsum zhilinae (strain DSM 4017 / NBRC 107636 / OCM 62 / WeN5) TaxID=679901 RepID=F7XP28_METZD|nr:V-type ATP synthase subunit C [Methanosalsum zhilinae]AEH61320.1 ATP synthase A1, C subunit [Methanosalsum zhilinae DSM 4017]
MSFLDTLKRSWNGLLGTRHIKGSRRGTANYSYLNARVRGMKSYLFPKETYPRLMNMEIDQIARFIQESSYKEDIDQLAQTYEGADLIEHALNRNLAESFTKLINISEDEPRYLITEYLRKFDVWNIKTILRGKQMNASPDEIKENLVSAGEYTYTFLSGLAEKESVEEVVEAFSDSSYYSILNKFDGTNLSDIENMLDKMYYDQLYYAISETKTKEFKLFLQFVQTEIDVRNLITLFRTKKENLPEEDIIDMMIDNGLEFDMDDIRKLVPLSFEEFIDELKKYSIWDKISDAVDPDMKSLISVETSLKKYALTYARKFAHANPLSIATIMYYILTKSNEVNNLRIIVRGKSAGLSDETIRNQLVI